MQRLKNLEMWKQLEPGKTIALVGLGGKRMIHVNAPSKTALWYFVTEADGQPKTPPRFLALVEGLDAIHFEVSGRIEITTDESSVMLYSTEFLAKSEKVLDPVIFTKIAERRARNPELEKIMHAMEKNLTRRAALQMAELERRLRADRDAEKQAQAVEKEKKKDDKSRTDKKKDVGGDREQSGKQEAKPKDGVAADPSGSGGGDEV